MSAGSRKQKAPAQLKVFADQASVFTVWTSSAVPIYGLVKSATVVDGNTSLMELTGYGFAK
jgi:hypothetical protein